LLIAHVLLLTAHRSLLIAHKIASLQQRYEAIVKYMNKGFHH
jgi:hypothetical protein